jgi:hypothetical protein
MSRKNRRKLNKMNHINNTAKTVIAPTWRNTISSNSLNKITTHIVDNISKDPIVYYSQEAWLTIEYLIKESNKEIGWLGLVEKKDDFYIIREIFVPEQTVTAATTDIEPEAMMKLTMQLLDQNKDPSNLRYWGHSHVNMQVSPSARDENQIAEYLEHADWFIRGIYNKQGNNKVDVYNVPNNTIHQCVTNTVIPRRLSDTKLTELAQILKTNIKETTANLFNRNNYNNIYNNVYNNVPINSIHTPRQLPISNASESAMELVLKDLDINNLPYSYQCLVCEYKGIPYTTKVNFTKEEVYLAITTDPFYFMD